eukprot:1487140-Rhodomonas_salina.2
MRNVMGSGVTSGSRGKGLLKVGFGMAAAAVMAKNAEFLRTSAIKAVDEAHRLFGQGSEGWVKTVSKCDFVTHVWCVAATLSWWEFVGADENVWHAQEEKEPLYLPMHASHGSERTHSAGNLNHQPSLSASTGGVEYGRR